MHSAVTKLCAVITRPSRMSKSCSPGMLIADSTARCAKQEGGAAQQRQREGAHLVSVALLYIHMR